MTLTGYIICKNEEAVIARCINSFKHVVDEIVVVDSGSTDKTVEIAQSLGAKVYTIEWKNDFSYARNVALSHCTGDWVFHLDADEYLREGDAEKIRPAIAKCIVNGIPIDALACTTQNIDPTTGFIGSEVTHLLAFRRTKGMRYYRRIHEQLRNNGKPVQSIFVNEIIILHTGYSNANSVQGVDKYARNMGLIKRGIADGTADGTDYYYYSLMGVTNQREDVDTVYNAALKMYDWPEGRLDGVPFQSMHNKYVIMALAAQQKGLSAEVSLDYIDKGIKRYDFHPAMHSAKGDILWKYGYLRKALLCYKRAEEVNAVFKSDLTNDYHARKVAINQNTATYMLRTAQHEQALEFLARTLEKIPFYPNSLPALLFILRNQPPEEIALLLNRLYDRSREEDIGFLVNSLMQVRIPLLLHYYAKIGTETFGKTGSGSMAALLSVGKYDLAVQSVLSFLQSGGLDEELAGMAVAGILLGHLPESTLQKLIQAFPPAQSIAQTLMALLNNKAHNLDLSQEEEGAFITAWIEMMHGLPVENARRLIYGTVKAFSQQTNFLSKLDQSLPNAWRYDLCEIFQLACNEVITEPAQQGTRLFNAGVCALMQNAPARALDYFTQAQTLGYQSVEMQEYQEILQEKLAK